ncbi:kinase [Pseudomaricurvus hydrocarbonicus]|nr:kinase [Aestuariicella hydrocarbonica]
MHQSTLMPPPTLQDFLNHHQLPDSYAETIDNYVRPMAQALAQQHAQEVRPLIVGVNGCQGSGKTTLSDAMVMILAGEYQLKAVAISIDDFYLTKAERETLATEVHPLLRTRGVPGTHDVSLALETLEALTQDSGLVAIPRFDKSQDDRAAKEDWDRQQSPLDIIILEGWCVGAEAEPMNGLMDPINELEALEDPEGNWRHYVNAQLQLGYKELFNKLDARIMLQAPSFDCVYRWRLEQEEKLKQKTSGSGIMSESDILRFIQHYQRITENTLKRLPDKVNFLMVLDSQRRITSFQQPIALS